VSEFLKNPVQVRLKRDCGSIGANPEAESEENQGLDYAAKRLQAIRHFVKSHNHNFTSAGSRTPNRVGKSVSSWLRALKFSYGLTVARFLPASSPLCT